jgi:hypothetical protein
MTLEHKGFLCRYRHLQGDHREWTKRILTNSELYFLSPSTFNDPFDCHVCYRSDFSKKTLKREHLERVAEFMPYLNRAQKRAKAAGDVKKADKKLLLHQVTEGLQREVENLGVLSLSAADNNILLWSHYACGHTGVCFKFVANSEIPFFGRAQPILYTDLFPDISFVDPRDRQMEAFLLTKAMDWEYEREWRIIDHNHGSGYRRFPEGTLIEVILGARMIQEDKKEIAELVNRLKSPVKLSQAVLHPLAYSLNIVPFKL